MDIEICRKCRWHEEYLARPAKLGWFVVECKCPGMGDYGAYMQRVPAKKTEKAMKRVHRKRYCGWKGGAFWSLVENEFAPEYRKMLRHVKKNECYERCEMYDLHLVSKLNK